MPFSVHFCNPCILPVESSILSTVPTRSSSSTIKSLLRHYFSKKRIPILQHYSHRQQLNTRKFQRITGSYVVREINPGDKSHPISKTSSNYDMTILHNDELDNTQLAAIRRRKKKIPSWATKDQLQLSIINQIYFQDQNPEDIFGTICIDDISNMIKSVDIKDRIATSMVAKRHFI